MADQKTGPEVGPGQAARQVAMPATLRAIYAVLLSHFGQKNWWPAETAFEVMIGAILTQNTAWKNVEKAIDNLKKADSLSADAINRLSQEQLAQLIRPSGYYNMKAKRLQAFCYWYTGQGGYAAIDQLQTAEMRQALLNVYGIGPETADDIALYAFHRPVFVIDAYTRRIFSRLGHIRGDEDYDELRLMFEHALGPDVPVFNEYHALIVDHAKVYCRKRPLCEQCPLAPDCKYFTGRH